MDTPEFPSNSNASKNPQKGPKRVERVTSGDAVRRKKSLRKQFGETFVAGDMTSAARFVVLDVLLPAAKDMIVEAGSQGIEKLIHGESSRRRGSTSPLSGATGYVSYNRINNAMGGRLPGPQRAMSRQARARHNFDEIILEQRIEAEDVIDKLFEVVSRYGQASIADLYELVGLASDHTDLRWGWTDLFGAGVSRTRNGYLLDLPDPIPLD